MRHHIRAALAAAAFVVVLGGAERVVPHSSDRQTTVGRPAAQRPVDPAGERSGPLVFRVSSATAPGHGSTLDVHFTATCAPGAEPVALLRLTVTQRTGAHVAVAEGATLAACTGHPGFGVLHAAVVGGPRFRPGRVAARVRACAGPACFEIASALPVTVT